MFAVELGPWLGLGLLSLRRLGVMKGTLPDLQRKIGGVWIKLPRLSSRLLVLGQASMLTRDPWHSSEDTVSLQSNNFLHACSKLQHLTKNSSTNSRLTREMSQETSRNHLTQWHRAADMRPKCYTSKGLAWMKTRSLPVALAQSTIVWQTSIMAKAGCRSRPAREIKVLERISKYLKMES